MTFYIPWLADAARTTGYRVVEVAGWRTRGHGGMRAVEGVVGHHTGTAGTAPGDYPSLGIVTNGRSDLAGPLAHEGLGRDGTIYIVAAGCCYHAGASRWAGFVDLNDEFIGIEAESPGHGEWTAAQRDCYPKLVAANLRYMSRGADRYAGHKDVCLPAGRKPDPVGIDTAWMQNTARQYLASGIPQPQENDMELTGDSAARLEDLLRRVQQIHAGNWLALPGGGEPPNWRSGGTLQWLDDKITAALAPLQATLAAIAAAVADGDLDPAAVLAQIDTAVRAATTQTITTVVLPALSAVVHEVLGEEHAAQAKAIVDEMAARLQPAA